VDHARVPDPGVAARVTALVLMAVLAAACGDRPVIFTHAGWTYELRCDMEVARNALGAAQLTVDVDPDINQDRPVRAREIGGVPTSEAFAVKAESVIGGPCGPTNDWFVAAGEHLNAERLEAIREHVAP
jgi:hypothetical protein